MKWKGGTSNHFKTNNGVKQGAILSPQLLSIYIDILFSTLRRRKIGCWLGGSYIGIVGYADDLFLICPSVVGLREMIKTCEEYAKEYCLTFSTDVSHPLKKQNKMFEV